MLETRAQRLKRCLQPRAVRFPELCSTPGVPALCSAQGHGGNLPESTSSFQLGLQRAGSSPCCQYGESRSPSTSGWKSNHAARSCSVRSHSGDRATCRAGMGSSSAPQKPHTRLWGEGNQRHLLLSMPTEQLASVTVRPHKFCDFYFFGQIFLTSATSRFNSLSITQVQGSTSAKAIREQFCPALILKTKCLGWRRFRKLCDYTQARNPGSIKTQSPRKPNLLILSMKRS